MRKILFFTLLHLVISCNPPTNKNDVGKVDKEAINIFIQNYITDKSKTQEYADLQKAFDCFYQNAVISKRRNYICIDTAIGEKFYGLDSLIIFNPNKDSAIAFYVEKLANDERNLFQYYAVKLFAYKMLKGWRFYDGCGTAIYPEKIYSYSMASNNERLWFANDGEWLMKLNNGDILESSKFIQHACDMWCGPCADARDSLNMGIYYDDVKKNTPPESLYDCR